MRALSVLLALASLMFTTACNREVILEKQVRVVFTNTTPDDVTLNIGGDDHVVNIAGLKDDQFYARLRMTGTNNGFAGPQIDWTDISISVLNHKTGRRSDQVMCRFQFGSVTYIEYKHQWLNCRTNVFF